MFTIEYDNAITGKYLATLIDQQFPSRRSFCRQYLITSGEKEPSNEKINNMSNRMAQIIKGTKAIQTYDLPIFSKLLNISCEQILSAGACSAPISTRVTNYSIACSKDPQQWEEYVRREDKLILNSDEYCKTVLDYALEFGNFEFIKFLMDNDYIWFDSRKDQDYIQTFGAGTSIERRHISSVDFGLESKINTEDTLRLKMIALAADHDDIEMLEKLRARENPQLYYRAHYLNAQHPDFDSAYNKQMVEHIAAASEHILDYFTDPFEIRDHIRYKDGSRRVHRFMFPYISKLLDLLISANSPFAETAIKKAIRHNEKTYGKLCRLIQSVKNDPRYSAEYMQRLWIATCQQYLNYFDNGNIIMFLALYSDATSENHVDGIITNVPHATKLPASPDLKSLVKKLNQSHENIKNIKDHLDEL